MDNFHVLLAEMETSFGKSKQGFLTLEHIVAVVENDVERPDIQHRHQETYWHWRRRSENLLVERLGECRSRTVFEAVALVVVHLTDESEGCGWNSLVKTCLV